MKRSIIFICAAIALSASDGLGGWLTPEQVSVTENVASIYPSIAIDREEDPGRAHVVWTESVEWSTARKSYYRCRSELDGWSAVHDLTDDTDGVNHIFRENNYSKHQFPHVCTALRQDPADDSISAAFYHRNDWFYGGGESGCIFYRHRIVPSWGGPYPDWMMHLHPVSGLADHVKDPFLLYHPIENDFFLFWSQHEKLNDVDHDIYYNFRAANESVYQWQYIGKALQSPPGDAEFFPFAAVNNAPGSPNYGDMYIVCWEYSFQSTDKLWFAKCDYQVTPPQWDYFEIELTENARGGASVAYYRDENLPGDVVSVVFGFRDPDEPYLQYLKFTQSFNNGSSWTIPIVLCWAAVPQGTIQESIRRPVIEVDADKTLYIAYVGYDNQVYVAKSEYDPLHPTERIFYHSNVVNNGRLHGNVYVKLDPNGNGSQQVVYDERTLEFPPNDYWKIFWTRWENDGESDYAPYDWSHEWY